MISTRTILSVLLILLSSAKTLLIATEVEKQVKAPVTHAVESAVVQFNSLANGIYDRKRLEKTAAFLTALETEAAKSLSTESSTMDAIRAIHNAEIRLGNFEYLGNANLVQVSDSTKIKLDCNMQSIVYLMTLESLAQRFPKIHPADVNFKSTLDHAFLELGENTIDVAHVEHFAVMNSFTRPASYDAARTLSGEQITSNMLLDFANDIENTEAKIRVLKAAAALDPNDINSRYNLASVYQENKDYKAALQSMSEAIALGNHFEHLLLRRAIIRINESQLFEGTTSQKKIVIEEAKNSEPEKKLLNIPDPSKSTTSSSPGSEFRLKNKEKINEILADFDRSLEINPYFIDGYLNRGIFYAMIGEVQKAANDYEKANQLLQISLKDLMANGLDPLRGSNNPFQGSSFVVAPNPAQALEKYNRIKNSADRLATRIKNDATENGKDLHLQTSCRTGELAELEKRLEEIANSPLVTKLKRPEGAQTEIHYYDLPSNNEANENALNPDMKAKDADSPLGDGHLLEPLDLKKIFKDPRFRIINEDRFLNNL